MEKILSLIIPTYNMEAFLDKCLSSLCVDDESLMDILEVIVVIDGATDSSLTKAKIYEDRFPDVFRVIEKENGNYGSCINRGLVEATGKYIKVLDADDSFNTDNFVRFVNYLKNCDSDLVLSDYVVINPKGQLVRRVHFPFENDRIFTFEEFYAMHLFYEMHAVTYRRAIFDMMTYHQSEGISYTDCEWLFKPMSMISTISFFSSEVYLYLVGREGQTVDKRVERKSITHKFRGCLKMIDDYRGSEPLSEIHRIFLWETLIDRIEYQYRVILLSNGIDKSILKSFDDELKKDDEIYEYLNKPYRLGRFIVDARYIELWRKGASFRLTLCKLFYILSSSFWLTMGIIKNRILYGYVG